MAHQHDADETLDLQLKFDQAGLLSAIIVDATDGSVLMLAHMNREALDLTLQTRVVHFYSRSRQTLWKKGETSGNVLELVSVAIDCDQDALLITANPAGPACHTGRPRCFYRKVQGKSVESATLQWIDS